MRTFFVAGERLMSRFSLAVKFGILAAMLFVPLTYVTWSFRNAKEFNVRIGVKEQHGDVYMTKAAELFALEVQARSAAVRGESLDGLRPQLEAGVGEVDPIVAKYSGEYTNAETWDAAKKALSTALDTTGAPDKRFAAWNDATTALYTDIQQVSGGSTLVLDPQLDTYNMMDSNTNRALLVMDNAGQADALATLVAHGIVTGEEPRIQLAIYGGNVSTPLGVIDGEYDGAYKVTNWAGLKAAVEPSRTGLDDATNAFVDSLNKAVERNDTHADFRSLSDAVREKSASLIASGIPALDHLLGQRISHFRAQEHRVYLVFGLGLLLAAYFFVGMMLSVRSAIAKLLAALKAAGSGDFTTNVEVNSRDELAATAHAIDQMQRRVGSAVHTLASHVASVADTATSVSSATNRITTAATTTAQEAARSAESAAAVEEDVRGVSVGTTELGASISQIAQSAAQASTVATDAVGATRQAEDTVAELGSSSAQIENVVTLIESIAEQTNLLALNATIEAARAGEAGKGFAIVANEVKELARQTQAATDDIRRQVASIQTDSAGAADAIGRITEVVGEVNDHQVTISSAVEEQAATTSQITASLAAIVTRSQEITSAIDTVAHLAGETNDASDALIADASRLADEAVALRDVVNQFRVDDAASDSLIDDYVRT